jgi:hypothetical protein
MFADIGTIANWANVISVFIYPVVFFTGRIIWKHFKAEMSPNHGSSMRDSIDRIEAAVNAIAAAEKKNAKAIKRVRKDLERHLNELEYVEQV